MSRELFSWVNGGAKNILHPDRIAEYGGLFYWGIGFTQKYCVLPNLELKVSIVLDG